MDAFAPTRPPPPRLKQLLEEVAAAMGLGEGRQRLELVFLEGALCQWWTHDEKRGALELDRFDEATAALVRRLGDGLDARVQDLPVGGDEPHRA